MGLKQNTTLGIWLIKEMIMMRQIGILKKYQTIKM